MSLLSNSVTAKTYWDFDPRSLPECDIWFDAADTTTLGLTGSTVNTWANKGSISMNATPASGTITSGNTENGKNYLSFPANSEMRFTCAIVNQPRTWFIVARSQTQLNITGGASPLLWGPLNYTTQLSGMNRIYFSRNGNVSYTATLEFHSGTVRLRTTTAPNPFATMMVISVVNSASSTALNGIFINGTSYALTTNLNAQSFQEGSNTYSINTASYASGSDICEIIHYGRDLSVVDRKAVEGYLMWKWGIDRGNDRQFNPATSLTNTCLVWYDADVNYSDATSRATSFTFSSADNISTWKDKSGNGRDATFTASGIITTRPTLIQNALYSTKCAVNFAGAAALSNTLSLGTTQSHTLFVVTSPNNTNATFQAVLTINGLGGTRPNMLTVYKSASNLWWYSGADPLNDGNTGSVTVVANRYDILAFYWDPTLRTQMNINGQYLTPSTSSPATLTENGTMALGATTNSGAYTEAYNGRIAEVILYDGILTTDQRNRVERYLSSKWNRPLINATSIVHPYSIVPPLFRPFHPLEIANCGLWLDAADNTTFTFSSGNNIATWLDKSGNGNTATATGTITNLGSINGRSCTSWTQTTNVAGGGVATYFAGNLANTGSTMTVFAVFQFNSASANGVRLVSVGVEGTADTGNAGYAAVLTRAGGTSFQATRNLINLSATDFSTVADIPALACSQFSGSNHTLYVNGLANTSVSNGTTFAVANYTIGNGMSAAQRNASWYNGTIGEVLIYNSSLTLPERQRIEGYLADKWGLRSSLPTTHFFDLPKEAIPNSPSMNPFSFTNLALWLDASDIFGNGASLPTAGSTITTWYDKSGNARNATMATASARPTFAYDGSNPAVQFAAVTGQYMTGTSVMLSTNYGIFLVCRQTVSSAGPAFYVVKSTSNRLYMRPGSYTVLYSLNLTAGTFKSFNHGVGNTIPKIMVISDNSAPPASTNEIFYTNGTLGTPISSANNGHTNVATDSNGYLLGRGTNYVDGQIEYFSGFIYEIIVTLTLPTQQERRMIEGYLARKWGILSALPNTHAFKRVQP